MKEVVTHPSLGKSCDVLVKENFALQKTCAEEKAKNELVRVSLQVVGFQMQYVRVAAGNLKEKLLNAINSARNHLSLKECLESIGLTAARYHSWVKRRPEEVPVGQQMVFADPAWYRIAREFNLRRPGVRIYPPKPKIEIRASVPNQIWRVNVSVFRIVNGARVYIQAIIDNASRYVLAWQVTQDYGGARTKELIEKALEVANRIPANFRGGLSRS